MDRDQQERAERRGRWPIRRFRLGEEPADGTATGSTAPERLQALEELSASAWSLAGRPAPAYERSKIPGRLVRRHA